MGKNVNKALSPEELTALSNIQSIISELVQMSGGVEAPMEEEVMMAENEAPPKEVQEKIDEEDEDSVNKGIITTPSDSATASDDAVERMEEVQTELTEENVNEVAKALNVLASLQTKKKAVKKSANQLILEEIGKVAGIQKSNQEQIQEVQKALFSVIEGMGITKQFEIAQKSQIGNPQVGQDVQNEQMLQHIKKALGSSDNIQKEQNKFLSNGEIARKNLKDRQVLTGILGQRNSRRFG